MNHLLRVRKLMKKPNKKSQQIKQNKSNKRNAKSKINKTRTKERLNAKSNSIEKVKKEMFDKYLQEMSEQFKRGSK